MLNSNLAQISALVGTFLPLLIAFIQREHWRNSIRTAVGVLACAVAAVVTAYVDGKLNLNDLATSAFYIFTLTKVTYVAVWKPVGVTPKIEAATGGGSSNPNYQLPPP